MRTWTVVAMVGWLLAGVGVVAGQGAAGPMDRDVVLPSAAGGWAWDGKELTYDSATLYDYIDGAAEVYLTYGFQMLRVRRLEKPGQPPITLELYEMASSEDAYGLFSFERQDDPADIGQGSEFGGGLLRFWKGRCVVSVYADGEGAGAEAAVLALGREAAAAIQAPGPEPKLLALIPGADLGLVEKSVRFLRSHVLLNQRFFIAHQNILGLGRQTEAVLAQYLRARQRIHLLLVRYPDPKAAQDAYQSFKSAYLPDAGEKDRLRTEDRKWTIARRRGEFVLVVFGAPTEADGDALVGATERALQGGR